MKEHQSMDQAMYFRGLPTKPDIDKLASIYGVPAEGAVISIDDAAGKLGLNAKDHRFKTVMTAWRKQLMRNHNVLLVPGKTGELVVADPDSRIDYSARKVTSGRRSIGKAIVVAHQTATDRLNADNRATRENICSLNSGKLRLAAGVQPKT